MYAYGWHAPAGVREGEVVPGCGQATRELDLPIGKAFTLADVAETLGISLRQVQAHVADGSLAAFNVGRGTDRRDLRVLEEELDDFARKRRVVGRPLPQGRPVRRARRAATLRVGTGGR